MKVNPIIYCGATLLHLLLFSSCKEKEEPDSLFRLMKNTGIEFSNTVSNSKDFNIFSYRNFYNGGGVAIGDINNDGLADVFFTANMGSNKLYLNKGEWKFDDISEKAGFTDKEKWSTGVVMVDINHDGWLDIYECNAGFINGKAPQSKLFINNRNLTFTESAEQYGLANKGGYTTHAAFFDYDLDGDLDVFIINNSFIPVNTLNYANTRGMRAKDWPVDDFLKGGGDRLLMNDNGKFRDVSEEAGIYGSLISFGLGVTVGDVNGDHYPDVYVSNDFFERDYLYINQKNGKFRDELEQWIQHLSHSSMGADLADINNDGYPDLFVTEMLPDDEYRLKTTTSFENFDVHRLKVNSGFYYQYMQNTLQVNNGEGKFLETAYYSGVAATDWSWGGLIFDADNDGLSDIFVCNGIYHDVTDQDFIDFFANDVVQNMVLHGEKKQVDEIIKKMPSHPVPNKAYKNLGGLKFSDAGTGWGLSQPSFSNGAAYGDLDNDGDLDLVVNNVNDKAFIYRNHSEAAGNNYISISLKGRGKNKYAIGSMVKLFQGDQVICRELIPSRGFLSSVDYKMVIGLGKNTVDSMVIVWPDRSVQKIDKPAINKVHVIEQTDSVPLIEKQRADTSTLLTKGDHPFEKHKEDEYIDFYSERNIPVLLSREGPRAAIADVNGDGRDDLYIGGAANQGGSLYLQTPNGFQKGNSQVFENFKRYEDVAVVFSDVDKDGDEDLLVGSGGNHRAQNSKEMQLRLYRNDGKGSYSVDSAAFPTIAGNTSVIAPHDFDNDGDIDVFVGSRSVPLQYGISPASYLFQNDGNGKFRDITNSVNSSIASLGMVTSTVWSDLDNDGRKELVIVGEWMTPRIFSYSGNKFIEIKTALDQLHGMWQTVTSADLDGDGDNDLVLGNIGQNFYLKPEAEKPVKMFIADFDNNGIFEKIITRTIAGKDMPVFLKRELTDQIPSLKKQNLRYEEFANRSIQELFPTDIMDRSEVKTFSYGASCVALNNGKGQFTIKALPTLVQLSSVHAIHCADLDGDGDLDILAGGNNYGFLPQFSRLDASFGHVLLNDGKSNFSILHGKKSGVELPGQIRDIRELEIKGEKYFLVLQNNDYPVLYRAHQAIKK